MGKEARLHRIRNVHFPKRFECHHGSAELTAVCPETRAPDHYRVSITYEPARFLVELRSLKEYFVSYRNREIYHEELCNEILEALVTSLRPRTIRVDLSVAVRGGIETHVTRSWPPPEEIAPTRLEGRRGP